MRLPISRFTVNGNSMLPTLHGGQDILSFNWFYIGRKPKIGDIVVIKIGNKEMVKRVQSVYGREVFVEGDNKVESTDSRDFGPVKMDQVVGKVIFSSENHMVDCPQCGSAVVGIYGRKDAICQNCGFKLSCCE